MKPCRRFLTLAALASSLALAGAAVPPEAVQAAAEDATDAVTERTIPVAPMDPDSTAGRIAFPIADWLEQRLGSGSDGLRLQLDAPMRALEQGPVVTVRFPGARLAAARPSRLFWALGDLAIAVTPRSGTAYDFEIALPPFIEQRNGRLEIGEGALSGTWRSDLEITTRLDLAVADLWLDEGGRAGSPVGSSIGRLP